MLHGASSCPLANNGSALDFDFTLVFNKNPLVCYEPDARRFTPARGIARGVLQSTLHGDFAGSNTPTLRKASDGAFHVGTWHGDAAWGGEGARIISSKTSNTRASVLLTCHVWGFYPAEVTVSWLHNGNVVGPGDHPPTSAIPNGDWTYQTQVTLMVAPTAGDTFACSVQHASLEEPLLEEWSESGGTGTPTRTSGSSPRYTPLPGDTYPAGNGTSSLSPSPVPKGHVTPAATLCPVPPLPGSI
uniref:Ig-like domain-containing protein n=1 Tax=Buteo japonicus TaxID=224669 RepID=A0A8C0HGW7_9AVES